MKVYAPRTDMGREKAGHDVHHKTCDVPSAARKTTAKQLRHAARQEGKREAARGADQLK